MDRRTIAAYERDVAGYAQRRPARSRVAADEYRRGAGRLARLAAWLQPEAILFVGLAGYRAAVDRSAAPGWQPAPFGGVAAYVMPSTSGLNARVGVPELAAHMRAALAGPLP
ncbi:MAG: hypothetical protein ACRDY7_16845 [Acidimicrobiia bacterium]